MNLTINIGPYPIISFTTLLCKKKIIHKKLSLSSSLKSKVIFNISEGILTLLLIILHPLYCLFPQSLKQFILIIQEFTNQEKQNFMSVLLY